VLRLPPASGRRRGHGDMRRTFSVDGLAVRSADGISYTELPDEYATATGRPLGQGGEHVGRAPLSGRAGRIGP
jgi:hypothetical protein